MFQEKYCLAFNNMDREMLNDVSVRKNNNNKTCNNNAIDTSGRGKTN